MNLRSRILALSEKLAPTFVEIRRHLHRNPELAFQEYETTRYLRSWLEKADLTIRSGFAETGVVGLLRGEQPGPLVALRGDIDALPLTEKTGLAFASQKPGLMHACGHDLHATVVIGAALILTQLRNELAGSVEFVLQAGEEKNPGGASILVKNGLLQDPPVDVIFGLHSDPRFRAGEIGYKEGVMMAEPDEFYLTIHGKGGHASAPHRTIDPIVLAADVILALQKIPSRIIDPFEQVVVSVSKVAGGHTTNVIPDSVELAGTVRTFKHELAQQVESTMRQILTGITSAYGATYELNFDYGYPVVVNDPAITQFLISAAENYLGAKKCFQIERPSFGGEDFSYYLQKVKGVFFRLGTGNPEQGITAYWHSSNYDVDEAALPVGAGFLAYLASEYLQSAGKVKS